MTTLFGYRITNVRGTVPDSDIIVGAIIVIRRHEGNAIERTYVNITTGQFSWGYDAKYVGPRCYNEAGRLVDEPSRSTSRRFGKRSTPRIAQFKRRRVGL